jgi:multisubunit Na+/H+ antiporter MnhE subunit
VKEFVVYTLMRLALLVATFAVIAGIWMLLGEGLTTGSVFVVLLISFVVSGIASYFLLNGQRVAFASKVERRADATMERMRTKEDQD